MSIEPIHSHQELTAALARVEQLWEQKPARQKEMSWKLWRCLAKNTK
ncbi:hypothetical protein [Pseudomonas nunensis]